MQKIDQSNIKEPLLQSHNSTKNDLDDSAIPNRLNESTASAVKDMSIFNVFCVVNTA